MTENKLDILEGIVEKAILTQGKWYNLTLTLNDEAYDENSIPKTKPIWIRDLHRINKGERVRLYYNRDYAFRSNALVVSGYEILDKNNEVT